jgi:hypothetical protein
VDAYFDEDLDFTGEYFVDVIDEIFTESEEENTSVGQEEGDGSNEQEDADE